MPLLIILIVLLIVAGIILKLLKETTSQYMRDSLCDKLDDIPLQRHRLLSTAELSFYQVLRSILPENLAISCKCRLEDFIHVENCPQKEAFRARIRSRHVDFVVYNPQNGYTCYAIELDDSSHQSERQKESDQFKDAVFRKVGMPLIRIPAQRTYQPAEIAQIINAAISHV